MLLQRLDRYILKMATIAAIVLLSVWNRHRPLIDPFCGSGTIPIEAAMIGPTLRANPSTTPIPKAYLCSSATPPGGGVHGMSGYFAARSMLKREFGLPVPSLRP